MLAKFRTGSLLLFPLLIALMLATQGVVSAPPPPNPVLYFTGTEVFQQGGKQFIRYKYDVFNKDQYPAAMFAAAPDLPPCGGNTKSSRTWVDFFDSRGKRLYGLCNILKPSDLNQIWFALEVGVV